MSEIKEEVSNNVFFQKAVTEDYIKGLCHRAVDFFTALHESKETGRLGRCILSLRPDEVAGLVAEVQKSQGLVIMGTDFVRICGTDIRVNALIVETV